MQAALIKFVFRKAELVMAVSYTHLDVYKRQRQNNSFYKFAVTGNRICLFVLIYLLVDIYHFIKRYNFCCTYICVSLLSLPANLGTIKV